MADRQAACLRGLEVDHQLELRRVLDGQVNGLSLFQDLVHERRRAPLQIEKVCAIRDETTGLRVLR
jgi:hypothetical protein